MSAQLGWLLVFAGLVIVATGLVWVFAPNMPWLGRLPGDIRIENENTRVYIPITTCLVLSVIASAVIWAVRRLSQ
jgi:hypothetical protein